MATILFLDQIAGIAGDMFVSSFLDAGIVTKDELEQIIKQLGYSDVKLQVESESRCHIQATHLHYNLGSKKIDDSQILHVTDPNHAHTHYSAIQTKIKSADLPLKTQEISLAIFELLANAEAKVHGTTVDQVCFHEVGAIDSILDIVLASYCLEKINFQKVYANPVKTGWGTIKMAHGQMSVPAPATTELLKGLQVDGSEIPIPKTNIELTTPTGAAIIKYLDPVFQLQIPTGVIRASGYGAGTKKFETYPNVFRLVVLETVNKNTSLPYDQDQVIEIKCHIDDQTPEYTAWVTENLFELGALDVWQHPIYMKKNRLGVSLGVLASQAKFDVIINFLMTKSTTFGCRYTTYQRYKLNPKFRSEEINGVRVIKKEGHDLAGNSIKSKLEYESVKRVWQQIQE